MSAMKQLRWAMRSKLWIWIAAFKFSTNQDLDVVRLNKDQRPLKAIPISQVYPSITINGVLVGERTPSDEQYPRFRYLLRRMFSRLFMLLNRLYPPMLSGLPSIDPNPQTALGLAYTEQHRHAVAKAAKRHNKTVKEVLEPPALPLDLDVDGSPDLGGLAVRGPFAGYLKKSDADGSFEWDLVHLGEYQPRPGLFRLGARVTFQLEADTKRLVPVTIKSEIGLTRPADPAWPIARKIALCALSNHTSLIRHWNWVHLIGGEAVSIVTRNTLPERHPFCRLLWPHVFGTQASNRLCTESQLVPGGDFEAVFSYGHEEMYRLFSETVRGFDVQAWDPEAYAIKRKVLHAGFAAPTEDNLRALYDVMHRHAARYLAIYYGNDAAVRGDRAICEWVDGLNRALPNGLPFTSAEVTLSQLARVAASCMYLASVQHELVGTFLWNYQLWTYVLPVRVYHDGKRDQLDVYQRLVNTNFMLNTPRAPLIADLTRLALREEAHPERYVMAVQAFETFKRELEQLQEFMEREPWMPWKIYPKNLEININA